MTTDEERIAALTADLAAVRAERDRLKAQGELALHEIGQQAEQLRRSEERMRLMIEAVTDYAIIQLDADGKIVSWNRGAERIKGYKESEIIGKPYETFFLPVDVTAGKPRRLLKRALNEGHIEDEGWRRRKDGTAFWADAVITALHDESGELQGFAKITRDLTDKKLAEAMALQNAQLAEANRLKSDFLAKMSHELRTPLNSIIGYTDLVLTDDEQPLSSLSRANLETVLRNGKHLLGLINDILDISKIEAGKMTVYASSFDLPELLRGQAVVAAPLARKKEIKLAVEPASGPQRVLQDETKVRQIVLNLISNALKFTPACGHVTVRAGCEGEDLFTVAVADTGIGIAPEHRELIFEEFRQVDTSSTREVGGTGLGLAISRKMARLLGGDLVVESALGRGSTFTLTLPTRYVAELDEPVALPTVPAGELQVLLAIDDDPDALRLLAKRLEGQFRVVEVNNGRDGLKLARELGPAAITLDVVMPGMDGWAVLEALKADPLTAGIPVVLISFFDTHTQGAALGAIASLTKPVEAGPLLRALAGAGALA